MVLSVEAPLLLSPGPKYSIMTTFVVVPVLFLLLQEVQLDYDNPIHNC